MRAHPELKYDCLEHLVRDPKILEIGTRLDEFPKRSFHRFRMHACIKLTGRLEDVTEEETKKILKGAPDRKLLDSLSNRLRNFYPTSSKDSFPIFARNLRVLLNR